MNAKGSVKTRSVQKENDKVYKSLIAFIWSRKVELNNVDFGFVQCIVNKTSFSVITFRSPTFLNPSVAIMYRRNTKDAFATAVLIQLKKYGITFFSCRAKLYILFRKFNGSVY